jgi:hypothetical protein
LRKAASPSFYGLRFSFCTGGENRHRGDLGATFWIARHGGVASRGRTERADDVCADWKTLWARSCPVPSSRRSCPHYAGWLENIERIRLSLLPKRRAKAEPAFSGLPASLGRLLDKKRNAAPVIVIEELPSRNRSDRVIDVEE